jgi:hypothetical protein
MGQCISAICVLALVILGISLMTRIVTFEQIGDFIVKSVLVLAGAVLAGCLLRTFLQTVLVPWLVSLRDLFSNLAVVFVLIIVLIILAGLVAPRFWKKTRHTSDSER